MGLSELHAACEHWRAREEKEVAAIVLQDKDLQRLLAVWPSVSVLPAKLDAIGALELARNDWRALWQCVTVDEAQLYEMTGLPLGLAKVTYTRAQALRLIYPDRTVHTLARMVLQKLLRDALQGKK